ncbi:hypothetical protein ACFLYF_05340 [Chloroflexota bacterium]
MRVVIFPQPVELKAVINPSHSTPQASGSFIVPGIYHAWPEAEGCGFIDVDIEGQTLWDLLTFISQRYQTASIDYNPICPDTNDLKFDFDLSVNGNNYVSLPHQLDTSLKPDDEVKITEATLGHC